LSPRRRAESLSRSGARQGLERRAERAGAGLALATPVRTEAAGEARAALLARTLAPAPDGAAAEIAPSPRTTPGRPAPVANALERPPGHPGAPAAGESAPREAAPRLVGLAGLAARAAAASPAPLPGPAPAAAIPAVLAERMEEAQLARRLDRLLRREAEQAGVDLEGLEP